MCPPKLLLTRQLAAETEDDAALAVTYTEHFVAA
jgi:hypothetical protein